MWSNFVKLICYNNHRRYDTRGHKACYMLVAMIQTGITGRHWANQRLRIICFSGDLNN